MQIVIHHFLQCDFVAGTKLARGFVAEVRTLLAGELIFSVPISLTGCCPMERVLCV